MKHQARTGKHVRHVFRAWYPDGKIRDFSMPQGTEQLMDDGMSKEILFDFLRAVTRANNIQVWIIGSDMYFARQTEEGAKQPLEVYQSKTDHGFKELQRLGWAVVEELFQIVAQTPEQVLMLQQFYVREPRLEWIGPPQEIILPQSQFGGRLKMYGATRDDITGLDPTRKSGPAGLDLLSAEEAQAAFRNPSKV
jgi:hypothetical protein